MFIRCRGGHDTVLSKILYRRHPLGLVASMWAPTGAEKARQEIKEARSFVCAPSLPQTQQPLHIPSLPPYNTHVDSSLLPFFLITVSTKGKKDKIVLTNGLKMSPTPCPFTPQQPEKPLTKSVLSLTVEDCIQSITQFPIRNGFRDIL